MFKCFQKPTCTVFHQSVKLAIDLPIKGSFAQCPSSKLTHENTFDNRCHVKSSMSHVQMTCHQIARYDFEEGGGIVQTIYPQIAKYDFGGD